MTNKRLFELVPNYKKTLKRLVLLRLHVMIFNISFLKGLIEIFVYGPNNQTILYLAIMIMLKLISVFLNQRLMDSSALEVKTSLHEYSISRIVDNYASINQHFSKSEVVQTFSEGVEQLEAYYILFLPQLFYALLAPLVIFSTLARYNWKLTLILALGLPLIPLAIVGVQKLASKMQTKYWTSYTSLGDQFIDFLSGLSTLKLFNADSYFQDVMDGHAASFRHITMKVLGMQLNNLTVMDLIAYGSTVLISILSISFYRNSHLSLAGMLVFIILAYEVFAPLRQLGSYFHVAMTGIAASKTLFGILDVSNPSKVEYNGSTIIMDNLSKMYGSRTVIKPLSLQIQENTLIGLVGESGSGKSTLLKMIMQEITPSGGSIELPKGSYIYVGADSEIFKNTVRFNLDFHNLHSDDELNKLLERLQLDYISLDNQLIENGKNLSGGERQRILLGRALLANPDYYCFDEITASVDSQSESIIMGIINDLKEEGKTIIFATHRLHNVINADSILVMEHGEKVGFDTHDTLIGINATYRRIWSQQQEIEQFMKGER